MSLSFHILTCLALPSAFGFAPAAPRKQRPAAHSHAARTVVSLRAPPRSAGKQGPAERGAAARAGAEGSLCRRVWMDGLGFLHAPCCPRSGRTPRAERPRGVTEPLAHLPSWLPRLRKWQPQLAVAPPSRSGPLQPARFHSGRGEGSGVRTPEATPSGPAHRPVHSGTPGLRQLPSVSLASPGRSPQGTSESRSGCGTPSPTPGRLLVIQDGVKTLSRPDRPSGDP